MARLAGTTAVLALTLLATLAFASGKDGHPGPREPRPLDDQEIVAAAQFAVTELSKLSESGVYETLTLHRITSAEVQEGVFHYNYFLTLELASPHFASKKPTSSHEVMVMRDLHDGVTSFAIDDFPVMDERAIEAFWERMVEDHRAVREAAYDQLVGEWDAEHPDEAAAEAAALEARRAASRASRAELVARYRAAGARALGGASGEL